jgi:myo-inositol-1(or 4)-monophosphatase
MSSYLHDLELIARALAEVRSLFAGFVGADLAVAIKFGGDPVTEADQAANALLFDLLPQRGDGWLSEETADDPARLSARRVWVVDPLDGTREFVQGIPEWCVSIALVEDGEAVAGGIANPATGETILGAIGAGVTLNGAPAAPRACPGLPAAEVLASRSEVTRGGWSGFMSGPFTVRPCGSVAYKLALVAAGRTDATWTLVPKHEWDVAAGVALVRAAGGEVWIPDGSPVAFNRPVPKITGLAAASPAVAPAVRALLETAAPPLRA